MFLPSQLYNAYFTAVPSVEIVQPQNAAKNPPETAPKLQSAKPSAPSSSEFDRKLAACGTIRREALREQCVANAVKG